MTTLLTGVNDLLTRVGIVSGSGELSSLTDSGRQLHIDRAVQIWNEAVDHLYDLTGDPRPQEAGTDTITLVEGSAGREYALPSDLVQIRWPLKDETNGHRIFEYPGGFVAMWQEQLVPGDYDGRPLYAAINPDTNKLRMDRDPTAEDAGLVYTILYDKDNSLSLAADTFPFTDAVYRSLIPALAEEFERRRSNDYDVKLFRAALSRASSFLTKRPRRTHW